MNRIKKSMTNIPGILLFALVGAATTASAQATDVNVVNTPTVILPRGSTVGIDSSKNTVKIDPSTPLTVRSDKMTLLYDEYVPFAPQPGEQITAPINVGEYDKIRVIVTYQNQGPYVVTVTPRVHSDNAGQPGKFVSLEKIVNVGAAGGTQLYEMPGPWMSFQFHTNAYELSTLRIQVYGKK